MARVAPRLRAADNGRRPSSWGGHFRELNVTSEELQHVSLPDPTPPSGRGEFFSLLSCSFHNDAGLDAHGDLGLLATTGGMTKAAPAHVFSGLDVVDDRVIV